MTYVSRRTRIIVSRWSDECDAEHTIRACKKRSDGRLKRHSSCDDLRAWVNDNCIKHEHLVDLMSDGEFLGKPPFRLFGRFIPVPILLKLVQNAKLANNQTTSSKTKDSAKNFQCKVEKINATDSCITSKDSKLDNDLILTQVQWEKNLLEKSLLDCTCILNKAMGKLENINNLVSLATDETENVRINEIHKALNKSKLSCTCSKQRSCSVSSSNYTSESLSSSKSYLKKLKDSVKCTELLRKISGLRQKLKKIQECRQEIVHQIRNSQQRAQKRSSCLQVTELYSRQEEAQVKRFQKKLEKLITERGRLLSEMCQALTCLNTIKKMSKSNINPRRNSKTNTSSEFRDEPNKKTKICHCGCRCSDNAETTDSEKLQCSESSSTDSLLNKCFEKPRQTSNKYSWNEQTNSTELSFRSNTERNLNSGHYGDNLNFTERSKALRTQETVTKLNGIPCSKENGKIAKLQKDEKHSEKNKQKEQEKSTKKPKMKYVCKEPSCRKILNSDDLSTFENALSSEQKAIISGALNHIRIPRPSTTPTTKREIQAVTGDSDFNRGTPCKSLENFETVPERRVKSETTMKEIEKTLRNYEQRLHKLNALEYRIEDLIQKSLEACRLKQKLAKMKTEAKEQRAADREKSNREITRLCSENWELKKQVLQLTAKFEAQCEKIQNLKCSIMKARELECETEELKKELSEYRDGFEHQRKCISKWESVVAMQRTEIENLMNHIRKLTTMREETGCSPYQDKRCIQRSRSYSPDKNKEKVTNDRPKTQTRALRLSSEEEEVVFCNCKDYRQQETKRKNHPKSFDRGCYSPSHGNMVRCD